MSSEKLTGISLKNFIDATDELPGICISNLSPGDVVEVKTLDCLYAFLIKDPVSRLAEATSNGRFITCPTDVIIQGSTFPFSSMIKIGYVMQNLNLEIWVRDTKSCIKLSETVRISVNGAVLMKPEYNKPAN